jgi:hypothetical protein
MHAAHTLIEKKSPDAISLAAGAKRRLDNVIYSEFLTYPQA